MRPAFVFASVLAVVLAFAIAGDGKAAFPGTNGPIVFDSDRFGDEQIFVIDPSGGSAEQLTFEDRNYSPAWSADGTRIAFVSDRSGSSDIWVMNANGSQQTSLTSSTESDSSPAWSADGNAIVYNRRPTAILDIEIWTVPANGSGAPAPFLASPGVDSTAAFSPDGTRIAFGHSDAADQDLDIYVADANGSNPVQLTDNDTNDLQPNWSPDGTRIAYNCQQGDDRGICVLDAADGGNQQMLRPGGDIEREPAWSPDGTRIVFEGYPVIGGTAGIYTMDPSGGDVQPVSVEGDYEPDWGPLPVVLLQGDVDCDGNIDEEDMSLLLEYIAGLTGGQQDAPCPDVNELEPLTGRGWGDVNCDPVIGVIDGLDAILIMLFKADLDLPDPVGDCFQVGDTIILTS